MVFLKRWFVVIFMTLVAIPLSVSAQNSASWTFMQYLALDNDLEGQIFGDMTEIAAVGSTDDVNFVVQVDRNVDYDGRFDDWTDARRYLLPRIDQPELTLAEKQIEITARFYASSDAELGAIRDELITMYDNNPADVEQLLVDAGVDPNDEAGLDSLMRTLGLGLVFDAEPVEMLGEVDMSDPATLTDFIVWSIENYPADNYALIISSHGAGWMGNGPDEDSGQTQLSLPEITVALEEARAITGVAVLDIVGFDACLMGQLEVYAALAPYARYVIAAQEVIPGNGWEYTAPLSAVVANPTMDALEVGTLFVDGYRDYYSGVGARTQVDLHVIDTSGVPAVVDALAVFVEEATPTLLDGFAAIGAARTNAQEFGASVSDVLESLRTADLMSSIDLIHMMNLIAAQPDIDPAVSEAALAVAAAAQAMVVYSYADDRLPDASGVAIYFPLNPITASMTEEQMGAEYVPYFDSTPEVAIWTDFLSAWLDTIVNALPPDGLFVEITNVLPGESANIYDPPVVLFNTDGQGISSMTFSAVLKRDDGTQIMLDFAPIAFESALDDGQLIYSYPTGSNQDLTFQWNVEMPVITDGLNTIPTLLQTPSERPTNTAYVAGVLETQNGESGSVSVLFDLETRAAISVFAVGETGAPAEVAPSPGDRFIPYWASFDPDGNFAFVPADSYLTFGADPFTFAFAPAESGVYDLVIGLQDYAGNSQSAVVEVSIDNGDLDPSLRGFKQIDWGINFLYPWGWIDPTYLPGDPETGDDDTILVNDETGELSIFVMARTQTDFDGVLAETLDILGSLDEAQVSDPIDFSGIGYPAQAVEYSYSLDGTPHSGVYLVIDVAENGTVYTLDVDVPTARVDEIEPILDLLWNTLTFFEPIPLGE